ncbi:E3 ubiquitin-protein ligase RNF6-like [Crotalus adamanteus]|uniref:E3 ubiquitin-protein ligase RNF6-like n=1 Tax=Crotalus adamanteus TaxID=8729 RepID=A0AAW1BK67_CROAD
MNLMYAGSWSLSAVIGKIEKRKASKAPAHPAQTVPATRFPVYFYERAGRKKYSPVRKARHSFRFREQLQWTKECSRVRISPGTMSSGVRTRRDCIGAAPQRLVVGFVSLLEAAAQRRLTLTMMGFLQVRREEISATSQDGEESRLENRVKKKFISSRMACSRACSGENGEQATSQNNSGDNERQWQQERLNREEAYYQFINALSDEDYRLMRDRNLLGTPGEITADELQQRLQSAKENQASQSEPENREWEDSETLGENITSNSLLEWLNTFHHTENSTHSGQSGNQTWRALVEPAELGL